MRFFSSLLFSHMIYTEGLVITTGEFFDLTYRTFLHDYMQNEILTKSFTKYKMKATIPKIAIIN